MDINRLLMEKGRIPHMSTRSNIEEQNQTRDESTESKRERTQAFLLFSPTESLELRFTKINYIRIVNGRQ